MTEAETTAAATAQVVFLESEIEEFTIEDGVVTKYKGEGGDVVIPQGVTSIEEYAFYYCDSLISVTIPDSVTSIVET